MPGPRLQRAATVWPERIQPRIQNRIFFISNAELVGRGTTSRRTSTREAPNRRLSPTERHVLPSRTSTSPLLAPSPLTRHRPQLTLLQTTPTAGNQHTDYGQRLEDDHNTTYGRPLVHVRRQQRVSPQQCRPPTEARTVSHAVSRTAARRRRRSRLQHVGAREVLCAGEGCTSVVSNVGWEEDV